MSAKHSRPRLSKNILEMKFMQRTKAKVDKEVEEAEGRAMYSSQMTDKMKNNTSNYILEPSFIYCENLSDGRLSFRGMNPEIERLLELEQEERDAAKRHEQPKEVSDQDMAKFYHAQQAPAASKVMQKKFQKINKNEQNRKRRSDENNEVQTTAIVNRKKTKFQKPREDGEDN